MKNMSHPIIHLEIPITDTKKSGEFYEKLFGWKMDYGWGPDYVVFSYEIGEDSGLRGGGLDKKDNIKPGNLIIYVHADNIEAMLERAEKLGGKRVQEKTEIPNVGWFGLFEDLNGNTIGLFTPKE